MTPYQFGIKMAAELQLGKQPYVPTAQSGKQPDTPAAKALGPQPPNYYANRQTAVRMASPVAGMAMNVGLAANNMYNAAKSRAYSAEQTKLDQLRAQHTDPNTAVQSKPFLMPADVLRHAAGIKR